MKQLELFEYTMREIQPQQRLATNCVVNSAYREVTNYMKPEEARYRAAMQMKRLSPEIFIVPVADTFHTVVGNTLTNVKRDGERLAGSESVARYQKDKVGTRETQSVPRNGVCFTKPIDGKVRQMTLWESDQPIVSEKSWKLDGEKGLTVMFRDDRDTSSAHRGGQREITKLSSLSVLARGNSQLKFTSLAHFLTVDFLKGCFRRLKKNKSSGVDRITVKRYEEDLEENLKDLVERLKTKHYIPKPVRRVYIPKVKGGKRPLGIPTVEDKIVQMALKRILEPIFEADFLDVSYGFRPNRGCHQALDVLDKAVVRKPVNYIADMDIKKFFDTVDHRWVMECLKVRIADPSILRLIGRFLKAGVMEDDKHYQIERGTPQGGILSPLLANIYLHYSLDLWFEKREKKGYKGFSQLIRYADDFVVCFQSGQEAKAFEESLKKRLKKFGLEISEEKSRIIAFGKRPYYKAQREGREIATFDFLGFTHYCTKTRRGYFNLGRRTSKVKFRRGIKEIKEWLKKVRNLMKADEWWKILRLKLIGHYRYYGISGNMPELNAYYRSVIKIVFKWLNRRSQKGSYNWAQFLRYMKHNPLPMPKIYHLTYTLFPKWGYTTEEPCEGKPQARFCEGY